MGLGIGQKRIDESKATEGVWANIAWTPTGYVWWLDGWVRPVGKDEPTAQIRVARSGNQRTREYRRKALRPYRQLVRQMGELPEEASEKVLNDTLAHTVLMDWDGVEIDGEEPKYTPELGVKVFVADPEFREAVLDISGSAQAFRDDDIAEAAEQLGNA